MEYGGVEGGRGKGEGGGGRGEGGRGGINDSYREEPMNFNDNNY